MNRERPKRTRNIEFRVPRLGNHLIVTDTKETERNYFNGIKNKLNKEIRDSIRIEIVDTRTNNLISKIEELENKSNYSQLWIVFDKDKVGNFNEIIKTATSKGIKVLWSNPCIEVWFLQYFNQDFNGVNSNSCCSIFSNKFLEKTGQEYKKNDNDIYDKLIKYGNEENAIIKSKNKYL